MLRSAIPNLFNIPTNKGLMHDAIAIWKKYDPQNYPLDETQIDIFALYAFDAAWFLILAIEKLCQQYPNTCLSFVNPSNCFGSQLVNHNELHQIMQTMNFTGVSGYVQFQSNTTDRINSTIAPYMIDNLQASAVDVNKLQVVEVLKLNGTITKVERDSTYQWIETGPIIRWPSKATKQPDDYALLKGKLDRLR